MDQLNPDELKQIAAALAGVAVAKVLKVRVLDGGEMVVVIAPGYKRAFSAAEVKSTQAALNASAAQKAKIKKTLPQQK